MREFTIGELSRLTQVNIETIRYYEKIGIMPNPPRNSSGYRIYSIPYLERLSFVHRSRELRFSQREVCKLLTLGDENKYTCAEAPEMTARHLFSRLHHLAFHVCALQVGYRQTAAPQFAKIPGHAHLQSNPAWEANYPPKRYPHGRA